MYPLGRIPSRPDSRDHVFSLHADLPVVLPKSFRAKAYPVLNQGNTPKCVAYSGALNRTVEELVDEKKLEFFDAPELYARCKEQDGAPTEAGTEIRVALIILKARGMKTVSGISKPIFAYSRLASIDEIKASVLLTHTTWIGSVWYNSWFSPTKSGLLPKPDSVAGGHAYNVVGWSDSKKAFKIQNSWGASWGLNGRAWLPYKYIDFNGDWEAWQTIDMLND